MPKPESLIRGLYRSLLKERAEKGDAMVTTLVFSTSADARQFEASIGTQSPQAHVVPGHHMIQVTTNTAVASLSAIECIGNAPARNIRVRFTPALQPA